MTAQPPFGLPPVRAKSTRAADTKRLKDKGKPPLVDTSRRDDPADQLAFDFNAPLETLPQLWTPDDIFNSCDQRTIELFGEDRRVERKRIEVNVLDLAEYLSMWANTQPSGGIVFIGVANSGEIKGCKHGAQNHLNEIEAVRKHCSDARIEFRRIAVTNSAQEDDFVLALRVYYREDKLVETNDGSAFVREGEEKRRLTETEKREIRLNKGEVASEAEAVNLRFPDDFDADLISSYHQNFLKKRSLGPRYTVTDVLQLSKLGKKKGNDFMPNLACTLLFAKDPRTVVPGAFIRVIRYEGSEEQFGQKLNITADRLFDGPIPQQIVEAEKFILAQMRNFTRLGADGRFATKPEYPREVWLEAVVNATVHRSYNLRNMNIFVKMFDDKLVIESPGTFMPPTTADTVYEAHNPRNPNLMWGLYYFDYVQCAFEGTRRMRHSMREALLPDPVFVQRTSGVFQVSVTLQNDVEHQKAFVRAGTVRDLERGVYEDLTQEERLVINFLAEGAAMNVTEAALLLSKDWRQTKDVLSGLEDRKIILRSPGRERNRHRRYYLPRAQKQ